MTSQPNAWLVVTPFLVGAVISALAPLPSTLIRKRTFDYYVQHAPKQNPPPVHLDAEALSDRVEWASDAGQAFTVTLVPVIGLLFAIPSSEVPRGAVLGYVAALLLGVLLFLWVLAQDDPSVYARRKVGPYSVVGLVALVANVVAAGLVLIFV